MANKSGIHINPAHEGEFRAKMHAKPGMTLSEKREHAAAKSAKKRGDVKEERQAVFAENAKKWNHKKGK